MNLPLDFQVKLLHAIAGKPEMTCRCAGGDDVGVNHVMSAPKRHVRNTDTAGCSIMRSCSLLKLTPVVESTNARNKDVRHRTTPS
jgi:hypothetical protein